MSEPASQSEIDELFDRGLRRLDAGEHGPALDVARRLHALRHTAAFELEARVHLAAGDPGRALAILEEGIARAPDVWGLLLLAGNLLLDEGRTDEAIERYERADSAPGADVATVAYNAALALDRAGRPEEALRRLDACHAAEPTDRGVWLASRALESDLCRRRGDVERARTAAERGLELARTLGEDGDGPWRAELEALRARI